MFATFSKNIKQLTYAGCQSEIPLNSSRFCLNRKFCYQSATKFSTMLGIDRYIYGHIIICPACETSSKIWDHSKMLIPVTICPEQSVWKYQGRSPDSFHHMIGNQHLSQHQRMTYDIKFPNTSMDCLPQFCCRVQSNYMMPVQLFTGPFVGDTEKLSRR